MLAGLALYGCNTPREVHPARDAGSVDGSARVRGLLFPSVTDLPDMQSAEQPELREENPWLEYDHRDPEEAGAPQASADADTDVRAKDLTASSGGSDSFFSGVVQEEPPYNEGLHLGPLLSRPERCGKRQTLCGPRQQCCAGTCVDKQSPLHCGECNRRCKSLPLASVAPTCSWAIMEAHAGDDSEFYCMQHCRPPFADLDGLVKNGCEVRMPRNLEKERTPPQVVRGRLVAFGPDGALTGVEGLTLKLLCEKPTTPQDPASEEANACRYELALFDQANKELSRQRDLDRMLDQFHNTIRATPKVRLWSLGTQIGSLVVLRLGSPRGAYVPTSLAAWKRLPRVEQQESMHVTELFYAVKGTALSLVFASAARVDEPFDWLRGTGHRFRWLALAKPLHEGVPLLAETTYKYGIIGSFDPSLEVQHHRFSRREGWFVPCTLQKSGC